MHYQFLQHVDSAKLDKFFVKLNQYCIYEEEKQKNNVYYALDSTSISTCAKELDFSEWGHNKDGDLLKQINIVMLVNQKTGCPLYYRVYSGATPDVSTVSHLLKEYCRMGFNRSAILVADRGYGSVKIFTTCIRITSVSFLICEPAFPSVRSSLLRT